MIALHQPPNTTAKEAAQKYERFNFRPANRIFEYYHKNISILEGPRLFYRWKELKHYQVRMHDIFSGRFMRYISGGPDIEEKLECKMESYKEHLINYYDFYTRTLEWIDAVWPKPKPEISISEGVRSGGGSLYYLQVWIVSFVILFLICL